MTTFAVAHGSGDGGWAWRPVARALAALGHRCVAPDLPTDRDDATWGDVADVLVRAVDGDPDVVAVGHSSGGLVAPLVAGRVGARLQVHVAGMVPTPGESAAGWFDAVGWREAVAVAARADGGRTGHPDPAVTFWHDVPPALAAAAAARERRTDGPLGAEPWPRAALPDVPARYVVTTLDRFLPPALQRRVAADRLGLTAPDAVAAGHCVHLARPHALAALLAGLLDDPPGRPGGGG
ncbi:alpha/beta fold hydrolase [Cellulomonas endophytica]|uniref:alpha/beta fold hydrolase n=1 Tax=Cellulomonas endophytica TaxID=2494735 RepID=UPI001013C08C|nr:alpha/beta hydrolase family protein [Cellulomonas endophytica]